MKPAYRGWVGSPLHRAFLRICPDWSEAHDIRWMLLARYAGLRRSPHRHRKAGRA